MNYKDVFKKYFETPARANYYSMYEHFHETLELYVHILILMAAFNHRDEEPTYNKYVFIIGIYADSYMVKLRQLITTNTRENSLLYQFYRDLIAIENKAYYRKEYDWLTSHYVNGPIDKYQKLEIHSNTHIKHYKRTNIQYHSGKFYMSFWRDPASFTYLARTEAYLNCISRTIFHFRRRSGFADLGYSPIDVDKDIEYLQSTYKFFLNEEDYASVRERVADLNALLYKIG